VALGVDTVLDKRILQWTDQFSAVEGGLLPCLHRIQATFGCIPTESFDTLADGFSISKAEVHGVVSFYHDFTVEPKQGVPVQICCAEACQAVGGRDLEAAAPKMLGVEFGDNQADGQFHLERVYCLGNCACGPSVRIADNVYGRATPDGLKMIVDSEVLS
jgi:formate dehydrogenase subunit gamma